jgi:hypothetical protein
MRDLDGPFAYGEGPAPSRRNAPIPLRGRRQDRCETAVIIAIYFVLLSELDQRVLLHPVTKRGGNGLDYRAIMLGCF